MPTAMHFLKRQNLQFMLVHWCNRHRCTICFKMVHWKNHLQVKQLVAPWKNTVGRPRHIANSLFVWAVDCRASYATVPVPIDSSEHSYYRKQSYLMDVELPVLQAFPMEETTTSLIPFDSHRASCNPVPFPECAPL